jgi:tetratricopeptide (TPR) repeat protein
MLLINYGRALRTLGRLDEAARITEDGHALGKQRGFEVVVNQSLLLLASISRERGEIGRSAAALDAVEPRLRRALPPDHPAFGSLMMEQALVAQAAGRLEDALVLIDRAYAIAQAAERQGASAGNLARVLIRRAELREAAGNHAAAAADARLAVDAFAALLPTGSLSKMQGDAYQALGRALLGQGSEREGREALRESLRHLDDSLGPENPRSEAVRALLESRPG